jgi:GT2 family glycosyltransferase
MVVAIPGLSVLIVNFNSGLYARDCIDSLLKQQGIALEIIVVDNASGDDSLPILRTAFGNQITLIASEQNLGFGRANNLAAKSASKEFLLLLNPDTCIADSHVLAGLVTFLAQHPHMGMVGPAIQEPRKGKQVLPRLRYPSARYLRHTPQLQNLPGDIAWLLGACMLMRRAVYEELHGFDPDYFLYGEDADICLRLRQLGYEIGYYGEVSITHVAGASEIGADSLDKWLRKKRGLFLFARKHFDRQDALRLAKSNIRKSSLKLLLMEIQAIFSSGYTKSRQDRKNKLQATKIAASELLQALEH